MLKVVANMCTNPIKMLKVLANISTNPSKHLQTSAQTLASICTNIWKLKCSIFSATSAQTLEKRAKNAEMLPLLHLLTIREAGSVRASCC